MLPKSLELIERTTTGDPVAVIESSVAELTNKLDYDDPYGQPKKKKANKESPVRSDIEYLCADSSQEGEASVSNRKRLHAQRKGL